MTSFLDDDRDGVPDIELDIDIDRLVAAEPPPPATRRIDLRPILVGLAVLVLGGGLGTAAYFLTSMDVGEMIGVLDVGDHGPRLSMEMPGRADGAPQPPPADIPRDGPLLAPPTAPGATPATGMGAAEMPPAEAAAHATAAAAKAKEAAPQVPRYPEAPNPRGEKAETPAYAELPEQDAVEALTPAPDEDLLRNTGTGPLPVIASDGRQPWREYARPYEPAAHVRTLAIVVGGLGLDRDGTDAAIAHLPPQVTLSFSPYAPALDKWLREARKAGHEVMIDLPTEPSGFPLVDPGPLALLTSINADENVSILERVLARMPGHVGVLAADGPFVRSSASLEPILAALRSRGLMYVGWSPDGLGDKPANVRVTEVVDMDPFREAIDARLDRALAEAREKGHALAVVTRPRPVTLDRILALTKRLNGVELAPATAVATPPAGGKS